MYVDDLADATIFVLENEISEGVYNVGVGEDMTIRELAERICEVVGFDGELVFDATKPDGTPRKLLDVSRLGGLGWHAHVDLTEGLTRTYRDFLHITQSQPQSQAQPALPARQVMPVTLAAGARA
jgi:GDP-L-fucose synthase